MGQGSYVICEFDSIQKEYPDFQLALRKLESDLLTKCAADWGSLAMPKSFGKLTPGKNEFGRTTILPGLFCPNLLTYGGGQFGGVAVAPFITPPATWRQLFTVAGHQTIMTGARPGYLLPEDFKVGVAGFMLPNKNQHLTEIKMQIGDRKYGRINLEEIHQYNKPAVILEEGFIIDEEESFELYGFIEGDIPVHLDGYIGVHQRIIPLGFTGFNKIDYVLGNCGTAI
jgi:hypothetical protein